MKSCTPRVSRETLLTAQLASETIAKLTKERDRLAAENKRFREALEWYATPSTWTTFYQPGSRVRLCDGVLDRGCRAANAIGWEWKAK